MDGKKTVPRNNYSLALSNTNQVRGKENREGPIPLSGTVPEFTGVDRSKGRPGSLPVSGKRDRARVSGSEGASDPVGCPMVARLARSAFVQVLRRDECAALP